MKNISGTEKRFLRDTFTKKLIKICERLDASPVETITWRERYIPGTPSADITIKKIWAVGSYARGALTCGDLDLVFEFERNGKYCPYTSLIAKKFFGNIQYTSLYSGTPDENSSGVAFPDAVEIWSGPGCDWKKTIDSITPDPEAGRASRPSDVIPLKPSQLNTSFEDIDEVIKLLEDGILESEFIEFTDELFEPLEDEVKQEMLEFESYPKLGLATRKILPAIFRVIEGRDPFLTYEIKDRSELKCGGTDVRIGRPCIPYASKFDDLSLRQVALVPHLTAKGPNGVWFLRRGPNHPLVHSFANKNMLVMSVDEKPAYVENASYLRGNSLSFLSLFSNKKLANKCLSDLNQGIDKNDEDFHTAKELGGKALHDAISGCDYIEIDNKQYALNNHAAFNLMIENPTQSKLKRILKKLEIKPDKIEPKTMLKLDEGCLHSP